MPEPASRWELLYETALSISVEPDLRALLRAFLPGLARRFSCTLAGVVRVKTEPHGWTARAGVRAYRFLGSKVKLYVTLPFFTVENALSRVIDLFLETGERRGVVVPESSVMHRSGKLGVWQVEGNNVGFKEIEGRPVEGRLFFVTKGLQSGNIVVLDAQRAREGKIRLW